MSTITATQKRLVVFFLLLVAGLTVIGARIAYIQFIQGAQLAAKARMQLQDQKALQSPRGTIYDRTGRELAISGVTKSLYANPRQLNRDEGVVAALLSPVLDMPEKELTERLGAKNHFMWLKRMLEADKAQAVTKLIKEHDLRGLEFLDESKRYYPNDGLAAHVLGFVGIDDIGLEGIEAQLDSMIKGEQLKQVIETDSKGNPIFDSILALKPRPQGKSVYLTIDSMIQFIVEQSLDNVMVRTKAQWATAIVMNPRTGEILAMASRPGYNPNRFEQYAERTRRNQAISIVYEPGSTFKPVIAAAAMQEGKVSANERFQDKGYIEVSGRRIKNWSGDSYGNISFTEVIKSSINTGFVEVGLRLGGPKLTDYARNFGFGRATGIELPGEEEGILFNPRDMRDIDAATMSIGHSIAVTPLQLVTALAAIANDGVLVKPHIIKEIRNPDGSVHSSVPTTPVRQIIHHETAKGLTALLEKVVAEGGGKGASVKGYRFAGKTGTAEKLKATGGYEDGRYIASFVGFGPVEDPQVVALIVIDDPVGAYYGGVIAAPVFSEIMAPIMRYLNIRPQVAGDGQAEPASLQNSPPPAAAVSKAAVPPGKAMVPNLKGKTIREAADTLAKAGLVLQPSGTGYAVAQNIEAESIVNSGTEIKAIFSQ